MDSQNSEITRQFSAAAYLNYGFGERFLDQVLEERHRAIGPNYACHLPTVLAHCVRARRRAIVRDVLLTAAIVFALGALAAAADYYSDTINDDQAVIIVLALVVLWGIVFAENLTSLQIVRKNLRKGSRVSASSAPLSASDQRLKEAEEYQDGNVVVYSGFSPFVGAGGEIGGWSFAININNGKEDVGVSREPQPFRLTELYDHVEKSLIGLHTDALTVTDRAFVNGEDVRNDKRFLQDPYGRPVSRISSEEFGNLINEAGTTVRHYKCLQVTGWKGELILSIFLRFARTGQNLFAETSYFLLTPLRNEYRAVDQMPSSMSIRFILSRASKTFAKAPFMAIAAPFNLLAKILKPYMKWREDRRIRRMIRENALFDYGAATTMRQAESAWAFTRYFQKLDKEMHVKIVERQLLDSVIQFLDSKDIDTSDLRDRQTVILNQGVIVSGGSLEAETLAVGQRAKAVVGKMAAKAKAATT